MPSHSAPPKKPAVLHASADMNVTPLIDVLLVLLIIFLAALPLTQQGIDTNVPPEVTSTPPNDASTHIVAEYTADHQLTINKRPVSVDAAESTLREIFSTRRDKTLFVIGAGSLKYGEIMRVVDAAKGAGVGELAIVTEGMRREAQRQGAAGGR